MIRRRSILFSSLFILILSSYGFSQGLFSLNQQLRRDGFPSAAHRGSISDLAYDGENKLLISAGEDGFIGFWDLKTKQALARFQISPLAISYIALRPGRNEIAVVESDGFSIYRVSVWDYNKRIKIFTLRFKDPISFLTYSAAGSYLTIGRSSSNGLVFIDPDTGQLLKAPSEAPGPISFIATGRSEKSLIQYTPQGQLIYWDLSNNTQLRRLSVPGNLTDPHLMLNNRFLIAADDRGIIAIDALTGKIAGQLYTNTVPIMVYDSDNDGEFTALEVIDPYQFVSRIQVSNTGALRQVSRYSVSLGDEASSAIGIDAQALVAMKNGTIWFMDRYGSSEELRTKNVVPVLEAAYSSTELGLLGFSFMTQVPADPDAFYEGRSLRFFQNEGYDNLTAQSDGENVFLLWNSTGAKAAAFWKNDTLYPVLPVAEAGPIKAAAARADRFLTLDASGRLSLFRFGDESADFTFSSLALLDAVFMDERRVLLGRSTVGSIGVPFLVVDTITGETVPGKYAAQAAVQVYRGPSGALYAAVISSEADIIYTRLVRISTYDFSQSQALIEYQGEDVKVQIAEVLNPGAVSSLATTLGGDGAGLMYSGSFIPFVRTAALPLKIISTDTYFVIVDTDGSIVWHDPRTGDTMAILRFYEDTWQLEKSEGKILSGPINHEMGLRLPS